MRGFLFGKRAATTPALIDAARWGLFTPRADRRVSVSPETALRHSAVWACLRLRANLISTLPVDVFRRVGDLQLQVAAPTLLRTPDEDVGIAAWLWASQYDLDRYGNCFGVITERTGEGYPKRVELVSAGSVLVRTKGRRVVEYEIEGQKYGPDKVWHERQYQPAGSPMGMSPIAYAAWSISGYLSAQQFALDWYDAGAAPVGVLQHSRLDTVPPEVAEAAKSRFKSSVAGRDIFVTGKDWVFDPVAGDANSAAFLDQMRYGIPDVCRFLDVPADMIDGETSTGSITYASITQRNVQLLVMSLTAPINRREWALTQAIPRPQFVKLNSDALLRMDPKTRAEVLTTQVSGRLVTPDEARALDDRAPLTEEQYVQFERLGFTGRSQKSEPAARAVVDGGLSPSNGGDDA